jgi:ABC-type multidrug transport system fused ATPase/permease subunit
LDSIHRARTRALANSDAAGIVIGGAAAVGAFAFAAAAVESGTLASVMLAGVPLITISAFEAVLPLPAAAEDATRASAAVARLDEITRGTGTGRATEVPDLDDNTARNKAPVQPVAGRTAPATPALELSDVWFSHDSRTPGGQPTPVLEQLSLEVQQGSVAIIEGPSGAGKSTVVDLLCGFSRPTSGAVRVMGVDIASASRQRISELVTVVRQDDHLFDTTVRDNLALARPDASDEEMLNALGSADAEHFVSRTPEGLGYRIGPNGENLSGGERQRLMIARALLREAPLLVLDEATTHLDSRSEAAVVGGVLQWQAAEITPGASLRTVVFISHHPPAELVADVSYEIRGHGASVAPARPTGTPSETR